MPKDNRYPCFMVATDLGDNPKIGRLTDREFRTLVTGVWALAAKASPRGYLVVAGEPATEHDVAHRARCTPAQARRTLARLRELRMLEHDPKVGLEYCHDWHDLNPDSTASETPDGWRERKRRSREKSRDVTADVTADVTELSRDVTADVTECHDPPPTPPPLKGELEVKEERAKALSRRDKRAEEKSTDDDSRLCRLLADLAKQRNPKFQVRSKGRWLTDMRLLRERDGNRPAEIEGALRWTFTDPGKDARFWADVVQSPGNLREHFPQIWAKMSAPPSVTNGTVVEDSASFLARRRAMA